MSPEEARATNSLYELKKQLKAGERIKAGRPASEADQYRGGRREERRTRGGRRGDRGGYDAYSPARGGRGGTRGGYPHSEPDPAPFHGAEGGRATSVPPHNYTWPQFIADLTHAVYTRDKDGPPDDVPGGYDEDTVREKVDQTVNAPDEIRSAYGGGGREKKEADDYDDNYDDDELNAREAVESVKGGDSRVADEYNLGGRRGGVESYTVDRDGYAMTATKGQRGGGGGPLIYIHCHNEPASNRDRYDDRYESGRGRTRGA